MNGYKTYTGIALALVSLLAMIGYDVQPDQVSTLVEAITTLIGVLGTILATYGRIDKENRTNVALAKAKDVEVKELLKEAKKLVASMKY